MRRIFRMVIEGKGVYQIADILSEEKVLCRLPILPQRALATAGTTSLKIPTAGGELAKYLLEEVQERFTN